MPRIQDITDGIRQAEMVQYLRNIHRNEIKQCLKHLQAVVINKDVLIPVSSIHCTDGSSSQRYLIQDFHDPVQILSFKFCMSQSVTILSFVDAWMIISVRKGSRISLSEIGWMQMSCHRGLLEPGNKFHSYVRVIHLNSKKSNNSQSWNVQRK